ncbi:MAG: Rpn family recombination-promoting nuclease/putative transposase [Rickettsia endosymbiont of Labidopullus appendiculatus]|nr:Rpn family recombination-promoting nuclease/putative transposase [Rickettsia endosymbiont of Labidopullus appendiculatus]
MTPQVSIFLLLEHQSTVDQLMAFRLFKYMVNICDLYLTTNPKAKHLPLIYSLILYNGKKKYNAPLNIWELYSNDLKNWNVKQGVSERSVVNLREHANTPKFYGGNSSKQKSIFTHPDLARCFWTNDCQLVNVHDIPDEELKKKVWSGILLFFLKHIHERQLLKRWQEISYLLPELSKITIGYDHIRNLLQYTLTFIKQSDKIELEKILKNSLTKEKGEELMPSIAQVWKEEGIQIGKAELIKMMIKNGNSIEEVARMTRLSITRINELLKVQ